MVFPWFSQAFHGELVATLLIRGVSSSLLKSDSAAKSSSCLERVGGALGPSVEDVANHGIFYG